MRFAVLVVAAGRGARAQSSGDAAGVAAKQYQIVGGAPMLRQTLKCFVDLPDIVAAQVVIHPDDLDLYLAAVDDTDLTGRLPLAPPVMGGKTRQESVVAGLEALAKRTGDDAVDGVLIHDAARPFVSPSVIASAMAAVSPGGQGSGSSTAEVDAPPVGALPAVPVADTLKSASETEAGPEVAHTVKRDGLYRAQTPQAFPLESILAAHRAAIREGRDDFTDDASLFEWRGWPVRLSQGHERNVKITTAEDLAMAHRQLSEAAALACQDVRMGQGYDVHACGPGDHVWLCGVRVPHDQSLVGHSDADVALHAITDAVLGALGDGDIGTHFPPSEAQWKGQSSDLFLIDAVRRVSERGGFIAHIDTTIVCERPKIGPHRPAMMARVADICGLPLDRVSIKATTSERLGFTGRGEGIAALAAVTIRLPFGNSVP